jgi:hypothetical protein
MDFIDAYVRRVRKRFNVEVHRFALISLQFR